MSGLPSPIAEPAWDECAQVVLTATTFDWFQRILRARGLYLFPIPINEDDLPTYGVGIGDPHTAQEEA